MIRPQDADFHYTPDSHWQWVETIALPFSVPEANINVIAYVLARPMLGVCMADVTVMDRISELWEEQAYVDNWQHMPCPEKLSDFSLPNGLSVTATEPTKRYHVRYAGIDDTSFDLDFRGIHDGYDINDVKQDPLAATRVSSAWDTSWSGHYEMTYHITGNFRLRGKEFRIDCYDTGDRSWGPRPERENASVIWWHVHFREKLAAHLLMTHDIAQTTTVGSLISGYIVEDGQTFGIVEATGNQDYQKAMPMKGNIRIVDERGKSFDIGYSTVNGCYWAPYPSNTFLQSSLRTRCNGMDGTGVQQLGLSRAYLTRNRDAIIARH